MDTPPRVHVSIVHWNGGEATTRCIESVLAQNYPSLSIGLVDNASDDSASSEVSARWPDIRVVRNDENIGFTGGHNRGIESGLAGGADYVLLLNQDAVLMPHCLDRMLDAAEADARIGMVSPVVYFADDPSRIQFAGSWIDRESLTIRYSTDVAEMAARSNDESGTFCLWGTSLLLKKALIDRVGMLDDRFFAYFEDTDLSVRAAAAGWKRRVCFDAAVVHEGHRGWRKRAPHFFYFMHRNAILFWGKHGDPKRRVRMWREALAHAAHEVGNLQGAGMTRQADACLLGLADAWNGRSGAFDPTRRAPSLMRSIVSPHPFLLSRLARVDGSGLVASIKGRFSRAR